MASDRRYFNGVGLRSRDRERPANAIWKPAAQVLERDGPAEITTASVAERAGVSIGTLYQYFPDEPVPYLRAAEREVSGEAPAHVGRQKVLMRALIDFLNSIGRMASPARHPATPVARGAPRSDPQLERRVVDWNLDLALVDAEPAGRRGVCAPPAAYHRTRPAAALNPRSPTPRQGRTAWRLFWRSPFVSPTHMAARAAFPSQIPPPATPICRAVRAGAWRRRPQRPGWLAYVGEMERLASAERRLGWTQRFYVTAPEGPPPADRRFFGCFGCDPPNESGAVQIHFSNRDSADDVGATRPGKTPRRLAELKTMSASSARHLAGGHQRPRRFVAL